jgi:hypothetical protein
MTDDPLSGGPPLRAGSALTRLARWQSRTDPREAETQEEGDSA